MTKKHLSIKEQIEYGLDTVDSKRRVEVPLDELIRIYKTFVELNQFFHQPMHYPTLKELNTYLDEEGAYSAIQRFSGTRLFDYLPDDVKKSFDARFEHPDSNDPYYFKSSD